MRISGVPVGKVKTIKPDEADGPPRRRSQLDPQYAPLPVGRPGDPAPEDAARRDLRRADAGHADGAQAPRGRQAAGRAGVAHVELDEIFRAFDPRRAWPSRSGCSRSRRRVYGRGQDINDALGNLAPVRDGRQRARARSSSRQQAAVQQLVAQHRRGVRRADASATASSLADHATRTRSSRPRPTATPSCSRPSSRCRPSSTSPS